MQLLIRMNSGEDQLTQGDSQMTSQSAVKLSDELLNTKMMTIENLIKFIEVVGVSSRGQ